MSGILPILSSAREELHKLEDPFALHPAQSSGRKYKKKQPSIFITPIHFSKIMKSSDSIHITPLDGYVAVPAYYSVTTGMNDNTRQIIDYLLSKELLEDYSRLGSFIPNHKDIPVDVHLDKLITRPWESLFNIIPDDFFQHLLEHFKLGIST